MRSLTRYSAVAALAAMGNIVDAKKHRGSEYLGLGEMPSQTAALLPGEGRPIYDVMPTQAPDLELMKRRIEERQFLTNTCTEWTILGGNGQPVCYNSQTCLFSTVGNLRYEGCGLTSIAYDWITECYNYPKSGTAGVSQTFCSSSAPICGVFEFVFDASITYSNFGCGTAAYSYIATRTQTTGSIDIAIGGSSRSTFRATGTVYVTSTPTDKVDPSNLPGTGGSPTPVPSGGSSTPIGAIVGGVIGGVAVIALLGFIAWYCLRKRKQDKQAAAATSQQQADAATATAYHNSAQTRMSEMDGTSGFKPGVGAFAPPLQGNAFAPTPEKNTAVVGGAPDYNNNSRPGLHNQYSSGYNSETPISTTGSPLPVYPHPHQATTPSSQFTELDPNQTARHSSIGGTISPGTGTYMSTSNVSELGDNRASYQAYHPGPGSPPLHEMGESAVSSPSGGINRRPVGAPQQQSGVDMSGNPLNSDYRPHELP